MKSPSRRQFTARFCGASAWRKSAADHEEGGSGFNTDYRGGSPGGLREERQFGGGYVSGRDRHHVRHDRELYRPGNAGHGSDSDDHNEIDDEEIQREEDGQKGHLLSRILRADRVRPQGHTARRPPAVVGANRTFSKTGPA